jgi:hypothetical protein
MSVIPAFRRLRQEDLEFQASLGYIDRACLKTKIMKKNFSIKLWLVWAYLTIYASTP